ncbi:MAG: hypothetical protein ACREFX_01230 [Opitutaceae bacterium]
MTSPSAPTPRARALTTFVGGARQPHLPALGDDELVRLIQSELASMLGIRDGISLSACRASGRRLSDQAMSATGACAVAP